MGTPSHPGPEPPPRRKRIALRCAALVAGAALATAATEAYARAFDPLGISYYRDTNRYLNEAIALPPDAARPDGRLFENATDVDLRLRDFRFRTDARGLRRGAAEPVDPAGRLRVLFLGDSVTLAWGVDDEDSWVRRLEREARAADGRALACFNAGHLQYNTIQEADWLAAHGGKLAPELVVVTVVVNDADDAWALYTRFMEDIARAAASPPGPLARLRARMPAWLRGIHGLLHYGAEQLRTGRTASERAGERLQDQPGYAEGWARVARGLDSIRIRCADAGIPLAVLDHTTPALPELPAWCEAAGVPCHDLRFRPEEWDSGVRNSPADPHANARGNAILAARAHAALASDGWLAPRDP